MQSIASTARVLRAIAASHDCWNFSSIPGVSVVREELMIKLKALFVFMFSGILMSAAQQPTSQVAPIPEDAIVSVEEQWLRASNEKDRKTLDSLMADDFMATTPIGEILGKSKLVPPDRPVQALPKFRIVAPVTHIDGDVAVLMAKLVDEQGNGQMATTAVFKRYGNQWKIIATQLSPLH
jgi:ketosteroid isomerase-like protein